MDPNRKQSADQARQAYIRQRAERNGARNDLALAEFPDAIAGDADGLLPVSALSAPIKVKVPDWRINNPPPGLSDELVLEWRLPDDPVYSPLWSQQFTHPISEAFPLLQSIDPRYFNGREGTFQFRYGVRSWNSGQFDYSPDQPVTLDRTPPYGAEDPPAVVPIPPVVDTQLDADGGIWLSVPDFVEDKREFVKVAVVWSDTVPPADQPIVPDIVQLLALDNRVFIERALIERFASGDHYVAYELFDKAGNRSRPSRVQTVQVARGPLPVNLRSPVVPLASDGLIDLADARLGVTVEIPAFDAYHPDDDVIVRWGSALLTPKRVGEGFPPFPVVVPLSWAHLRDEYTNAPDTQSVPVTYLVRRGTTPFPLPAGDGITVDVNLAYPGPVNPDEPDPINGRLPPLVVTGDSGTPNHLTPADAGKNATASLTLYDPPGAGEVITVYWNGVPLADSRTLDGSETAGDPIEFNVLWSEIEAGQSGVVPVFYSISHADFVNEQRSKDTLVQVEAVPVELPAPTFPDLSDPGSGNLLLNCQSLRQRAADAAIGYRVAVPASAYLVAGESVELRWVLLEADQTTEVSGSELVATLTIPAGAETSGLPWFVQPYVDYILPAHTDTANGWGYAKVTYKLTVNNKEVESKFELKIVGLQDLDAPGQTCDLTAIPEIP
ncbi:hypothetical protein [uncultured Pseudomonas sp.]|uniref:hypothetical protein n=1 Tax=uncultured Pseudomonas sp. TaxID=114707 RepID=UPI0025F95F7E|nr:hypothetical protein [uncultured Pseudomonas sp.]